MKKEVNLVLFFTFVISLSFGQNRYFVYLKDKAGSNFSISSPEKFLSPKSIERRKSQNISVNSLDIPVSSTYISQIKALGAKVIGTSKWLNAVLVDCTPEIFSILSKQSFFKSVDGNQDIRGRRVSSTSNQNVTMDKFGSYEEFSYGNSLVQIQQLGVDEMHKNNFTGKGILIAVFDAGFDKANTMDAFKHLFSAKRIIKTYDFVSNDTTVYESHWHGTAALSCIGAKLNGQLVGTAPDADFALYRTEDVSSETRIEEVYWLFAAENADSLGVDVINSSLGYYSFDNPATDYKFEDLNGDKTISARAADFAVTRGIIVVNSAGNEGNNKWNHIVTPADADSVIAVGAVDLNGNTVGFSSPGPNAKNNIKPEVSARGSQTSVAISNPNASFSSGTSFSSPLIAGMVAGLKQQFPKYSAMQIRDLLIKSASKYETPDNKIGYGIPSYKKIVELSKMVLATENDSDETIVFPNPVNDTQKFKIKIKGVEVSDNQPIEVFDLNGRSTTGAVVSMAEFRNTLPKLEAGTYIIKMQITDIFYIRKFVKL
ncbi:S8 family serine peptidase [Lacihabitans soyangensis]|uniref:T9SS C-terminal target domain-containing protein n=1 Tax=Lacihabitans soyangensis TaxID=869394 RepID=A0AAE3KU61_9BACT|nr:S8 family serine peptidase [Lacihabitans soyangensis]MCP9765247.1 T9SS C-terminal target domain-containing protein [Lacihabitans soyangensis]